MEDFIIISLSFFTVCCLIPRLSQATPIDDSPDERHAYACYGTQMNFLEASCPYGQVIRVNQVFYGAKLKSTECPNLTTHQHYRPECCTTHVDDCMISLVLENKPDPYFKTCNDKADCTMNSRWLDTSSKCDQKLFLPRTNYMAMIYTCVKAPNSTLSQTHLRMLTWAINQRKTIPPQNRGTRRTTKETTATTATTTTTTTTKLPSARHALTVSTMKTPEIKVPVAIKSSLWNASVNAAASRPEPPAKANVTVSYRPKNHTLQKKPASSPDFAFTTGMVGGMIAAVIGMMLTIFGFIFYWGRRKRKAVTMKPNSTTVWDFLLSHTVASRTFRRGYDNFGSNSNCSSVSSEGDMNSPTARKTTWLPNITVDSGNFDTSSMTSDDNISRVNVQVPGPSENGSHEV